MRAGHYWHWTSNRIVGPRFDKISVCCCAIAQLYNAICGNKERHPPSLAEHQLPNDKTNILDKA